MSKQSASAFAPASIGNLGVGFDVLGLAIQGAGDTLTATRSDVSGVIIEDISGDEIAADAQQLSRDANANTAGIAAASLWAKFGDGDGIMLRLHKGTPLGSGMGSSAASAVAGVVAVNALLPAPLPIADLLPFALDGEAFASKARHADNVAPCLLGGMILCPPGSGTGCARLPVVAGVSSVLVHPHLRVDTAAARAALRPTVELASAVTQMGLLACFVHACHAGDRQLLATSLRDVMIEPQRKHLVRGFDDVQSAALAAGSYGCSLSGSGPSLFALCNSESAAQVSATMQKAFESHGIASNAWVSPLDSPGARVVSTS